SFGASGLPNGLSVNTSNGQITGTPTTNGTFNVTIGATNLGGSATATLVYTIAKANLTVTGITAKNKPFDGTTAATLNVASAALAGVVTGDSITLNTGGASGTFASSSVGSGKLVTISGLTISGAASGNYTLTQPTTTANITTPMTVSLSAPSTQLTSSGPVTYTVTYTSANTITLGSGGVTLNRTGTANGTVVVSGSGNSTRTVTVTNIIGEGSLGISVAANTATDIDGNPAPAAGPSGTFTVNIPPAVTAQPASQTVPPATNATFSVTGTGTAPLKYQWSKDNVAVVGATNSTFTVTNTARASVGLYSVTLSNAVGLAQSSNALLRVVIPQVFATPIRPVNGTFTWLFRDSTGTVATLDYASNYFQMQASTNLSIWQPISGNLGLTNGWLSFQDSNASLFPNRFYRLRE
ncbi:MAG: hypothetical protein JWQ04_2396, partial [Pedosphaera sp.]|nr:hypothetical protein [Pedosphaera sp.]